ncbi:chitobiase/beta-hexosaminidase C-terminal domain-containing protein [Puniceicoccaceae bacterium K14]|nr:chitobiase/beta-hexosaminidase C-terminal domain-containing protein [Puniceicoccaceae bacterium K14]
MRFLSKKLNLLVTVCSVLLFTSNGKSATSVSQGDVTWTFDKDYEVGQFVNGDFYVVSSSGITVTNITPEWDGTKNGSQINPIGTSQEVQGLDKRVNNTTLDSSLNIADNLPYYVSANSSIVSAVGRASQSTYKRTFIEAIEILTVLPSTPPTNSFRPPFAGTDKTIRGTLDSIDTSWLHNLEHPNNVSSPNSAIGNPQIDWFDQWQNSDFKSENTEHTYGRSIAYDGATAVLWLHLSNSFETKKDTLINVIQRGIDTFGIVHSANFGYWPNGGHNVGRKLYLLFAAKALEDEEIMSYSTSLLGSRRRWQEDEQHFYVTQEITENTPSQSDRPPYGSEHIGMADWTSNAYSEIEGATPLWDGWSRSGYRFVNGAPNVGQVLAAELSGLRDDWDWEPFFDYIEDRYWSNEKGNYGNGLNQIKTFHKEMWELYKDVSELPDASTGTVQISPKDSYHEGSAEVQLSVDTGETIYYTTDGSTPTSGSNIYSETLSLISSTNIKALSHSLLSDPTKTTTSQVVVHDILSTDSWKYIELPTNTSTAVYTLTATPLANSIDTVIGLSTTSGNDTYSSLACIVRFNASGYIDARNGSQYTSDTTLAYQTGQTYQVKINVNLTNKKYDVSIQENDSDPISLATQYDFRSDQSDATELTYLSTYSLSSNALGIDQLDINLITNTLPENATDLTILNSEYSTIE